MFFPFVFPSPFSILVRSRRFFFTLSTANFTVFDGFFRNDSFSCPFIHSDLSRIFVFVDKKMRSIITNIIILKIFF